MKRLLAILGATLLWTGAAAFPPEKRKGPVSPPLPMLGTRLSEYPEGKGKLIAEKGCLQCHSADIPRQQRLTEKQWTAEVDKMIRWGADVSATDKPALVSYLADRFGTSNDAFRPVEVAPAHAHAR